MADIKVKIPGVTIPEPEEKLYTPLTELPKTLGDWEQQLSQEAQTSRDVFDVERYAKPMAPDYREPGIIGQFGESIKESGIRAISAFGSSVEAFGVKFDNEKIKKAGRRFVEDFQVILAQHPEWQAPTDMGKWKDPQFYARLVGNIVPSIAGAFGTSAAVTIATGGNVPAGIATGFLYSKMLEGGFAYQEARSAGATEKEAQKTSSIVGTINGVLEMLPIGRVLNKIPGGKQVKRNIFNRVIREFVKQGIYEGSTEAIQEIVNNAFQQEYNENRGLFDGVMEALVGGMIAGGVLGGGVEFVISPEAKELGEEIKNIQPGLTIEDITGRPPVVEPFIGFEDVTTKVLEQLKGKTEVSSQFILDQAMRPELKQAERDLIREVVNEYRGVAKIPVKEFAEKVKMQLLPLEVDPGLARYENISLPDELRGNIANYHENIYEGPIKTSAGDIHFTTKEFPNYFAHVRVEDLVTDTEKALIPSKQLGETRRIIELQSDLFQKGRLGRERPYANYGETIKDIESHYMKTHGIMSKNRLSVLDIERIQHILNENLQTKQLQLYRNTWHERIIREEIKRAAQDGKTTLQFPTGETAMKIEGLGDALVWATPAKWNEYESTGDVELLKISEEDLIVGNELVRGQEGTEDNWIITEVIGDGKFKAIPKKQFDIWDKPSPDIKMGTFYRKQGLETYGKIPKDEQITLRKEQLENFIETFDISGKIDTSNPIYRFYEKEVQRFLKRIHPEMKRITDPQGVEWFEIKIKKVEAKAPVIAFNLKTKLKSVLNRLFKADYTVNEMKAIIEKATGVKGFNLKFVKKFQDEGMEGSYFNLFIKILTYEGRISEFTGLHESWHLMRDAFLPLKDAKRLENYVVNNYHNRVVKKIEEYKKQGKPLTERQAAEEILADEWAIYTTQGKTAIGRLTAVFLRLLQKMRGLVGKADVIITEFEKIEGKPKEQLRKTRATRFLKMKEPTKRVTATEARKKLFTIIKEQKESVASIKQDIVNYARQELDLWERGKLLAIVKNVKTYKGLNEAKIYIQKLATEKTKRILKTKIKKELKDIKVRKQAGKPVGRFTPEVQVTLNLLREASRLKQSEAEAIINLNFEKYKNTVPPEDVALKNKILTMVAGMEALNVGTLKNTLSQIKEIKDTGRLTAELKKFNRKTDIDMWVEKAIDVITGGKGLPKNILTIGVRELKPTELKARVQRWMGNISKTQVEWEDIIDRLARLTKEKPGTTWLDKFTEVGTQENAVKKGNRLNMDKIRAFAHKTLGVKNDRETVRRFQEDAQEVSLGTFKDGQGHVTEIIYTKAEARQAWMEMQDPTLDETFELGMFYTNKMKEAINNFLTPQDKAFAQKQLNFYQDYYKEINKIYGSIYGVHLPHNEHYVPIAREGIARSESLGFGEFMQEMSVRKSVTSGSLKSRVKNIKPLKRRGDIAVLEQHIAEMEHFKAWAHKIRDLRAVFGDANVRTAIIREHGKGLLATVDNFLNDFTRGGTELALRLGWLDKFRGNYSRAVLAVKASIGVKQLTSFIAYADSIPVKDFGLGVIDFWRNPVQKVKILRRSEMMKVRGKHMERDVKTAIKSDAYGSFRKNPSFLNSLMLNIQAGDQGAIFVGGWPVYRYYRRQGKTHAEALKLFENITSRTQQSADLSKLSTWQRGGSFAKLFTMFKSAPNMFFRKELAVIRNRIHGRVDNKQIAKTLAIYHVLLPMLFQWVSDWFKWDKEEQRRAVILGPFNGIFILGDMFDTAIRYALGMRVFDSEIPMYSIVDDIGKSLKLLHDDDITTEDVFKAIRGLAGATGALTGKPIQQPLDIGAGIKDVLSGEFGQGLGQVLGWSAYKVKPKKKKEKAKGVKIPGVKIPGVKIPGVEIPGVSL